MLRIHAETPDSRPYCDGLSRRSFVQIGVAGMALAGMSQVARAKAAGDSSKRERSCILIWLDGGPSHLDMYDMKPQAAPEVRGIWNPIPTNVPGIEVTELYPLHAKVADKFSIIRSVCHESGDHFTGGHRMLTTKNMGVSGANNAGRFPSIGSIISRERGAREKGMPAYVGVPHASSIGLTPGYFAANWLGAEYNPFQTGGDANASNFKVSNLDLQQGLTLERLNDRRTLIRDLDRVSRSVDSKGQFGVQDRFDQEALDFVTGNRAKEAFDIGKEDARTRELYGRHSWGQSTLLARRLVEYGSTFVTVHFGGWDHHWDLEKSYYRYLPQVDRCVYGLFTDLAERGLLESTLVVLCGEFSRTPKMNDGGNGGPPGSQGTPGRDHWGASMSILIGGGGVKGGTIVGSTDEKGTQPKDRPLHPENLHATIYTCLGMDPKIKLLDPSGRPTPVLEDPTPISELL